MTFGRLVRTLLRRWYLTLPLLALAAYSSLTIPPDLPVEYETTAAVVLVGPEITEVRPTAAPGARNRLLHLGDSLESVGEIVTLTLDADSARQRFARDGLIDDYRVSIEDDSPIIELTVAGEEPELVDSTVVALITTVESEIDDMQTELAVPTEEQLIVRRISSDNVPRPGLQSDKRSQVLLLAAGAILTIGVVVAADAALERIVDARSSRRRQRVGGMAPQVRTSP